MDAIRRARSVNRTSSGQFRVLILPAAKDAATAASTSMTVAEKVSSDSHNTHINKLISVKIPNIATFRPRK